MPVYLQIISFAMTGLLAGIAGGLLGVSGGIVTIPCLFLIFQYLDFPAEILMHVAVGSSLAAMVFNSYASMKTHMQKRAVYFDLVKKILWGIIFGGIAGVFIARELSSDFLKIFFGAVECCLAIYFFCFKIEEKPEGHLKDHKRILVGSAPFISTLATMLGLGGGFAFVPLFLSIKMPIKKAIGTASMLSFITTLVGASIYFVLGFDPSLPVFTDGLGYIYLPAWITVGCSAYLTAPFGARLAHVLPSRIMKKIFSICLFIAGILMIT